MRLQIITRNRTGRAPRPCAQKRATGFGSAGAAVPCCGTGAVCLVLPVARKNFSAKGATTRKPAQFSAKTSNPTASKSIRPMNANSSSALHALQPPSDAYGRLRSRNCFDSTIQPFRTPFRLFCVFRGSNFFPGGNFPDTNRFFSASPPSTSTTCNCQNRTSVRFFNPQR